MKTQQSGFTLIELIAVIVILGILAATALPRFVNMSDAAQQAAVDGVAANLGSAMALNYAAAVATNAGIAGAPAPVAITNCQNAAGLLVGGALPTVDYAITSAAIGGTPGSGTTVVCTLTLTRGAVARVANFNGIN